MSNNKQKKLKHRIKDDMLEGIKKGHNSFFFHGIGLNDIFFYNYYYGVLSLKDTFCHIFLDIHHNTDLLKNFDRAIADYYVYINRGVESVIQKNNDGRYQIITEQFFEHEHNEGEFEGVESNLTTQEENTAQIEKHIQDDNKEYNYFLNLLKKINEKNKKVGIFIEGMEWFVSLYKANNDDEIPRIKIIQELIKNKKVILAFSVPKTEMLERYHFDFEGKNTIYVGLPTAYEIKLFYLRRYLQQTELITISPEIILELNKISSSIVASKKSLQDSLRIFDTVVNGRSNYNITYEDFKSIAEKQIDDDIALDDVILDKNTKDKIIQAIDSFLENNDPKERKKGLIFSGPPGTGKTFVTKAIAKEKDCFFMAPSLSDLKGEYVGQTSGKVKRIFEQARASQPAILFIDEADTIFPSRDLAGSTSDSFNLDMVNQFLVEIDGAMSGNQKIFVIAATNRVDVLDSAIKSRLGEDIAFPLPNKELRKELFQIKLLKDGIDFKNQGFSEEIAVKTEGMSGRDIDNFVKSLKETARRKFNLELSSLNSSQLDNLFFDVLKERERSLIKELNDRKISISITPPSQIDLKGWESIIGYENIKEEIDKQVHYIKANAIEKKCYEDFNIPISKGILLYGPPGNGKSMLSMAAAKQHNFYFVKVLSKDFASINPDITLKNLQIIFSEVLKLSKMLTNIDGIILFFDEYDSLASKIQLSPTVRGTLLDYIADNDKKGLRSNDCKILFMAATNFREELDEALTRKGRIDTDCFMDNPTEENGKKILLEFIQKNPKISINANIIPKIYNCLTDLQKQKKRAELQENPEEFFKKIKMHSNLLNGIKSNKEILEIITNDIRPSGAELENIIKKLIEEAFRKQIIDSKTLQEKLIIDDNIINKVFSNN